jgi:transcriptional regulator with XRE-family HTH domain
VTLLQFELKYGLGLPVGVQVVRRCAIPKPIILSPITIGEHIKRERLKRDLRQCDVGMALGVNAFTIMNWEKRETIRIPRYYPLIIAWLGYDPFPMPRYKGEKLRYDRLRLGLTSREMAARLEIDQSTLLAREKA